MGSKTAISWTEATVNFWTGCIKVSPACKYCYMYRDKERYMIDPTIVMRTKDATFNQALSWKEQKKIFTCSWSDFFIEQADQWRDDAWKIIKSTPQHKWQILTKRPERIKQCLPKDWNDGYDNVWLGVSVENQDMANLRIPILLEVPAKVRFLSCEPLLEPVDLEKWISPCGYYCAHSEEDFRAFADSAEFKNMDPDDQNVACSFFHDMHHHPEKSKIDWVIIGGESGFGKQQMDPAVKYKYRKCEYSWISDIVQQCRKNNVPVFVKQLGNYLAKQRGTKDRTGSDINEFPQEIKYQQFPNEKQEEQ